MKFEAKHTLMRSVCLFLLTTPDSVILGQRVMSTTVPEGCLAQLDELSDTLSALPHAVQRYLTQLREQDA